MEKYFIVTEESKLRQRYMNYLDNSTKVREFTKQFKVKYGIEADAYIATNTMFCIEATENDKIKFSKMFNKDKVSGLNCFKKNSIICKDWVKSLADNNLEVLNRPSIVMYFSCWGKSSTRLFSIDDTVYCSYRLSGDGEIDTPEGMTEIKASEFFKIIEDYEAENKS